MSPDYLRNIRSKGERSRSHGHKVQKHISVEGDYRRKFALNRVTIL